MLPTYRACRGATLARYEDVTMMLQGRYEVVTRKLRIPLTHDVGIARVVVCRQLQGASATLVPYSSAAAAAAGAGACSPPGLAQLVVNGVGPCSPPAVNACTGLPYTGFLVAGFNGFCTEDQLKELLGRCALGVHAHIGLPAGYRRHDRKSVYIITV